MHSLKNVYLKRLIVQGENGDLKNRGLKVEMNHIGLPSGSDKAGTNNTADFPDSSIGEGMDITIQGANGHVKKNKTTGSETGSLKSYVSQCSFSAVAVDSASTPPPQPQLPIDNLKLPPIDDRKQRQQLGYSTDMSIGRGMDISIRGDPEGGMSNKENYEQPGDMNDWAVNGDREASEMDDSRIEQLDEKKASEETEEVPCEKEDEVNLSLGKNVEEALFDPVDDVVVEQCCPDVCYRVCPCCIGDPDSPFWQLWYRHRLQVSRYVLSLHHGYCIYIMFSGYFAD